MSRMQIAGVVLFLVALAGFIVLLPKLDETGSLSTPQSQEGNKSPVRIVNSGDTPDAVLQPSARIAPTAEAESRGMQIELMDLSGFEVGDAIALYIPQEDVSYSGKISDVNVTGAGNRVMTGFLEHPSLERKGQSHRFIFTVGQHQTFGTIQTSLGRYQLETRGGVGRIISVAAINEGLDFSQPDFVLPSRRQLPPEELTTKEPPTKEPPRSG